MTQNIAVVDIPYTNPNINAILIILKITRSQTDLFNILPEFARNDKYKIHNQYMDVIINPQNVNDNGKNCRQQLDGSWSVSNSGTE